MAHPDHLLNHKLKKYKWLFVNGKLLLGFPFIMTSNFFYYSDSRVRHWWLHYHYKVRKGLSHQSRWLEVSLFCCEIFLEMPPSVFVLKLNFCTLIFFRILFPEIKPKLTTMLKERFKVWVFFYLFFFFNKVSLLVLQMINVQRTGAFTLSAESKYQAWRLYRYRTWLIFALPVSLCRWCFLPIKWELLEASSDQKCSSLKLRIFFRLWICLCRFVKNIIIK